MKTVCFAPRPQFSLFLWVFLMTFTLIFPQDDTNANETNSTAVCGMDDAVARLGVMAGLASDQQNHDW